MSATSNAQPMGEAEKAAMLDAQVSADEQMGWLKTMTAGPNHLGSPHNQANAARIEKLFREWGWQVKRADYQVLYPTPISTVLELVGPVTKTLGGQEPGIPEDATSNNLAGALPPYVAYQGDGDVTAPVVYVNYGLPGDYEALARRGISVKGKIVIARYGGGWRGLKPKLAQEQGAIGCLIYSDPQQDGYGSADSYPNGGGRPPAGVQRGSVLDMITYPGDPLTPGVGATRDARRLTRETAPTVLKIPTLPISYADATEILSRLKGAPVPNEWRGGLPFHYRFGGSDDVKVHLAVKSDWTPKMISNVIATLPGSAMKDEWVVRGNHYDGWVFGAADPLSGEIAMLSEAKGLGALWKAGWRPKRSIVYASWDGEEPGLLGSTEWVEENLAELKQKAVIYINTDGNGRGFLGVDGSQQFQSLAGRVAAEVKDPQTGASVADRWRAGVRAKAFDGLRGDQQALAAAELGGDQPLGPLGSGSDYTAFIHHAGVPSLNLGFGGEGESAGSYHSIYDSYDHFVRWDDPGLAYGAALAKVAGRMVLRLADADVLPLRFGPLAGAARSYLSEIRTLIDTRRREDDKRAGLSAEIYRLGSDPRDPLGPPLAKPPTPQIELAALDNAITRLEAAARAFDGAISANGAALTDSQKAALNARLKGIDQALLSPSGLPFRPWFRNILYAPGRFTGYGAKTLPGLREAVEERRFDDANREAGIAARALNDYADRLNAATAVIR
ncbi:transferrin receptor-like dimerization domain-containing protein [Sandarakinorhabdus sp. AAP62]|uniref:transferrin receptor-like dimerization domain-containing protein n=1 Tax=Sandarakinorhabdus sp. AAP62 TaxID=1248916 RepID=UPI001FB0E1BF|nr:transferrin receptor-like dimerization domain-containing protein [Sandarakinorhabdus sp. AAP62]